MLLPATHCMRVVRLIVSPAWAKTWHCRYNGRCTPYFHVRTRANMDAPAKLFWIGRDGAGALTIRAQPQQRFLGRMCRVTVNVTVFASSTSDSSGLPSGLN